MFEYKDSYAYGFAVLLLLVGLVIDLLIVRCGLAIATITLLMWPTLHRRFGMSIPLALILVCGIGIIAGGAWYGIDRLRGHNRTATQPEGIKNPLDNIIQVDCRTSKWPELVPSYPFYDFQLMASQTDGGYGSTISPPGSKYDLGGDPVNLGTVCRLTNFGSSAILNVETEFTISYREAVKVENGTRSGDVVLAKVIKAPRVNLGTGDRNIAEFFFRNRSDYWVSIAPPMNARVQAVGSDELQTVRLVPSQNIQLGIMPSIPPISVTNPPASPPPAPEPPVQPGTR